VATVLRLLGENDADADKGAEAVRASVAPHTHTPS
jgi:hypothetical protein